MDQPDSATMPFYVFARGIINNLPVPPDALIYDISENLLTAEKADEYDNSNEQNSSSISATDGQSKNVVREAEQKSEHHEQIGHESAEQKDAP